MYHSAKHSKHLDKVRKIVKGAGYSTGGQNHSLKKVAKKEALAAVHEHEKKDHPGKSLTKLKSGGVAEGTAAHTHLGKAKRGGKQKGGSHVHVNVVVPQSKTPMSVPSPMAGGAAPMPPRPPMPPQGGAPMPGGAPMGAAPAMPPRPPGMKTGGKVLDDHGSLSGEGRLSKIKAYGGRFPKHKKGGKVDSAMEFGHVTEPVEDEGESVKTKKGKQQVE